jgi:hypothetical protein
MCFDIAVALSCSSTSHAVEADSLQDSCHAQQAHLGLSPALWLLLPLLALPADLPAAGIQAGRLPAWSLALLGLQALLALLARLLLLCLPCSFLFTASSRLEQYTPRPCIDDAGLASAPLLPALVRRLLLAVPAGTPQVPPTLPPGQDRGRSPWRSSLREHASDIGVAVVALSRALDAVTSSLNTATLLSGSIHAEQAPENF